jgi:hypothetical protein
LAYEIYAGSVSPLFNFIKGLGLSCLLIFFFNFPFSSILKVNLSLRGSSCFLLTALIDLECSGRRVEVSEAYLFLAESRLKRLRDCIFLIADLMI